MPSPSHADNKYTWNDHTFSRPCKHPLPPKNPPPHLASSHSTPLPDFRGSLKCVETSGQQVLTQGVASRPAALADQPLPQAEEQQGRVVWSNGRQDAQDGADEGGGQEAYFTAKPSEARRQRGEVSIEYSQGRWDSKCLSWETRQFF